MLTSAIASFVGWNAMGYASLSSILQAVLKAIIAILLIVFGFGAYGAVLGHSVSYLVAGGAGLLLLYVSILRSDGPILPRNFLKDIRSQIAFGIPSEFSANISNFVSTTYVVIVLSAIAGNAVVGWFQAANNFTTIISIVSGSLGSALFPAFTSIYGRSGDTSLAFKYAVKYVSFLAAPIMLFLAVSSRQLVEIIYGSSYLPAAPYLILFSLGSLPGNNRTINTGSNFQCGGKNEADDVTNLSSVLPVVLLAPVFGYLFGPYGLILACHTFGSGDVWGRTPSRGKIPFSEN